MAEAHTNDDGVMLVLDKGEADTLADVLYRHKSMGVLERSDVESCLHALDRVNPDPDDALIRDDMRPGRSVRFWSPIRECWVEAVLTGFLDESTFILRKPDGLPIWGRLDADDRAYVSFDADHTRYWVRPA